MLMNIKYRFAAYWRDDRGGWGGDTGRKSKMWGTPDELRASACKIHQQKYVRTAFGTRNLAENTVYTHTWGVLYLWRDCVVLARGKWCRLSDKIRLRHVYGRYPLIKSSFTDNVQTFY